MKILAYLALLAVLAGIVVRFPMLWELAVAGAIGGVWWIFFRGQQAPEQSSESSPD